MQVLQVIFSILIAILVFGLLIFVHELGHFLTAKWMGIRVNEFAIGMGPAIFKKQGKQTLYALRAIPFGGYCAMEGENGDSEADDSFFKKPAWRKIIVVAAGSVMNILLGFVLLLGVNAFSSGDQFGTTEIDYFADNATSVVTGTNGGLQTGDKIVKMNGMGVSNVMDINLAMMRDSDGLIDFVVVRDGQKVKLPQVQLPTTQNSAYGVSAGADFQIVMEPKTFFSVMSNTFTGTASYVKLVWTSLYDLVTGRFGISELSGPVGTTAAIGQAAQQGPNMLFTLIILISINLGVMNLLPIPALDGGRLIFLLIELVRRKPINPKYEGIVHMIGFLLLIALIIFVTFHDIVRLFSGG